jgi:hypothetical protein
MISICYGYLEVANASSGWIRVSVNIPRAKLGSNTELPLPIRSFVCLHSATCAMGAQNCFAPSPFDASCRVDAYFVRVGPCFAYLTPGSVDIVCKHILSHLNVIANRALQE